MYQQESTGTWTDTVHRSWNSNLLQATNSQFYRRQKKLNRPL